MLERHPILSRAMLSGVLAFVVFGGIELALGGSEWSELYTGDPGSFWTMRPDLDLAQVPHIEEGTSFSVKTNGRGQRDGLIPVGVPWVLALGCSTTFGWGVKGSEAWPEVLERELGMPVFNAGVPGHSTEQGKRIALPLFKAKPSVAILGWGLRDAQRATIPDAERRTPTFPRNTALFRWLARTLRTPIVNRGHKPRVSASRLEQNLRFIIDAAEAEDVQVMILDMTGRSDTPTHGTVLTTLDRPVVVPRLAASMYFESDPIHLTVRGNRALAQLLAPSVSALLAPLDGPPQPAPMPRQTP